MAFQIVPKRRFLNLRQWLDIDRKTSAKYCDVSFIVDGQKYPAHKCILKWASSPFERTFSLASKNYSYQEIIVEGISKVAFEFILDVVYYGKIGLEIDNISNTCILSILVRNEDD